MQNLPTFEQFSINESKINFNVALKNAAANVDVSRICSNIGNLNTVIDLGYEHFPYGNIKRASTKILFSSFDGIFSFDFKSGNSYEYEQLRGDGKPAMSINNISIENKEEFFSNLEKEF